MIEIELNGEPHAVAPACTLSGLVEGLGLGQQALALAVNRAVVPRAQWPQRVLNARDRVDLVRAIGGG
ncbi:sulfur carrier protein ThiS [Massilia glaciei]|uniref:Thiamine biosynthesis protein ThiS n=1 Tax=Massilia glaciei TaxID=1524097 RepID=A0A2U2HNZ1_9BURK|nr:sulfur carrier protein ThiS [Massilia glaciei]PWF49228.1 thiamine biosynthesis protein ThiS [Massilia glaciei]